MILQQQSCSDPTATDNCDPAATDDDYVATDSGDSVATDSYDSATTNNYDPLYHNDSSWWNVEGHGSIMEASRKSKCVEIISWLLIRIPPKYSKAA